MTLWFSNWNQCLYNWISEQGWESFYLRALQPVDRPERWTIRVMWTSYSSSPDPRGGRAVTHCSLTHKKHEEIFFVDAKRKISGVQFFVHGTRFSVTRSPECTKHNWGTWEALSLSLSLLMATVPHTVGVTSLHCFDLDTHFIYPLSLPNDTHRLSEWYESDDNLEFRWVKILTSGICSYRNGLSIINFRLDHPLVENRKSSF